MPNVDAMRSVVTGERGLVSTDRRYGVWVDMSIVAPAEKRELADVLAEGVGRQWIVHAGHRLVAAKALAYADTTELNLPDTVAALDGTIVASAGFDHRAQQIIDWTVHQILGIGSFNTSH